MRFFYKVAYSNNGRIMFQHFDFFHEALDFINQIRKSGERANLYKFPLKEWGE